MHDKNGTPLKVGDNVILSGTIQAFTSEQPTYCNIMVLTHESMAPEVQEGTSLALSARMVVKGTLLPPEHIQEALRGAAFQIREQCRQLDDQRRIANAREDVLQATITRLSHRGYPEATCSAQRPVDSLMYHHVASTLERLADSMRGDAKEKPDWRDAANHSNEVKGGGEVG